MKAVSFIALIPLAGIASPIPYTLTQKLDQTRIERLKVEQNLIDSLKDEKYAKSRLTNLRKLIKLQKAERAFLELRQQDLEKIISTLVIRKTSVQTKIQKKQAILRSHLKDLAHSFKELEPEQSPIEKERYEAAKTKIVSKLADRSVRDIESLKADWQDAEALDLNIQKERDELATLVQDFEEREQTLKLNQKIEAEMIERHHQQSSMRLALFQRLKERELEVENLIAQFNARQELERVQEDQIVTDFGRMKGKLALPVMGTLSSQYGQGWDEGLQLNVFKKGVEISVVGSSPSDVRAIYTGKVAFSGTLPNLGQVVIIDHGGHYFSLCGKLGSLLKNQGDTVAPGDVIGKTNTEGQSVYFEIRSRNVPLNPLQWVNPSSKVGV